MQDSSAMRLLRESHRAPSISASLWIMAARPRTLSLSITPVAVGAALAWAVERQIHWPAIVAALASSVFIQIGTNLHNDAIDSERGGDGPDRIGPPRVVASGWLEAIAVERGAAACFAVAAAIGGYLVFVGGWPILLLGFLSILSGWAYTGGRHPIAYTPLGELFVLAFFGVAAVCGTYWLCTSHLNGAAVNGGLAVGSLTAAVLLVNNYRDVEADARAGRKTLPILAGATATVWIYAGLMLFPFPLLWLVARDLPHSHVLLALIALPLAIALIWRFARTPRDPGFNRILTQTVLCQFVFSLLLTIGLIV